MLLAFIKSWGDSLKRRHEEDRLRHCFTFTLNGTRFGIDTRFVREIARYKLLGMPSDKPDFVRGMFRHQEKTIPVLDISARYGLHPLEPGGRTCIMIIELGTGRWRQEVGLMVDEVLGVSEFPLSDIKPVPEVAHRMLKVEIVEGMVRLEKEFLIVLDAWQFLSNAEMEELLDYMRSSFGR